MYRYIILVQLLYNTLISNIFCVLIHPVHFSLRSHVFIGLYIALFQDQIPFDTYFRVDAVQKFHRAITMEKFMKNLAPKIWPVGNRTGEGFFKQIQRFFKREMFKGPVYVYVKCIYFLVCSVLLQQVLHRGTWL